MSGKVVVKKETQQVIECKIGEETFAVPISLINEIIQPQQVTPIPKAHPAIKGLTQIRGEVFPVVDLATVLAKDRIGDTSEDRFIVVTIDEEAIVFVVHGVVGIHNVDTIEEPSDMYRNHSYVTGVIQKNEQILLVLDFAKILSDIRQD